MGLSFRILEIVALTEFRSCGWELPDGWLALSVARQACVRPEFTAAKAEPGDDLVGYKKAIVEKYGKDNILKSWLRVCKELESLTDSIAEQGTAIIPEVAFEEISRLTSDRKQALKDVGCFVVRGVVSREQADEWFTNLKEYVAANRASIGGWPKETPFILNLYFPPTQMAARSQPNQLKLSEELNSWWHDKSGGSLSRWADPTYQSVYSAVFSGTPELLDNYDLSARQNAKQAIFPGNAHSRIFRSFQGWTALTSAGFGEGSLMLYPNVKWTVAYLLLRPFFQPPAHEADVMDASKWTFDVESPSFPGTFRDDSQLLSPTSHPHLRLRECMVGIPKMNPGDTIWWHADMCHAVEVDHNGDHEASVAYIAAAPRTEEIKSYIRRPLEDFLNGIPPEDIRGGSREKDFKLFTGEVGILSGEAGRRAMGFNLIA